MIEKLTYDNRCIYSPGGFLTCDRDHLCNGCPKIPASAQLRNAPPGMPMLDWRDAAPDTPSAGNGNYWHKPVILTPGVLKRKCNVPENPAYQILFCTDGSGVFKCNPAGEIDGYLLIDRQIKLTVARSECYGLPTRQCADRLDSVFSMELCRLLGYKKII